MSCPNAKKITITASSGLSKEEVERMTREAEIHAAEDARKRETAEARNTADTLAYTAEKTLREQGDKVADDLKQEVEGKIAAVRSALSGSDVDQLQRSAQELSEAMQRLGAAVYQQAGTPPPEEGPGSEEGPGPEETKTDEGTVEGEFREV